MSDKYALSALELEELAHLAEQGEAAQVARYSMARQELFSIDGMLSRFAYLLGQKAVVDLENPNLVYPMKAFREVTAGSRELVERRLNRNSQRRLERDADKQLRASGQPFTPDEVARLARSNAEPSDWIEKSQLVADKWLASEGRLDVVSLTFVPNSPRICPGIHGETAVNLWSPPGILKVPLPEDWEQRAAMLLEHLNYLVPEPKEAGNVLRWIAHLIQRPERLPGWHLLMVAEGKEGTGRNWLARLLAAAVPEYTVEDLPLKRLLDGKHNSEIETATLGVVDEIREGGSEKWKQAEALKSFLTAKSRTINPKFLKPFPVRNYLRVMMFSNNLDALPIGEADRRHYVVRCTTVPRGKEYFDHIYAALEDRTNLRAVYEYLLSVDLAGFDIEGRAPDTDMKLEVIAAGRSEEENELRRLVKDWGSDVITATRLRIELQRCRDEDLPADESRASSDQLSRGRLRMLYLACGVKALGENKKIVLTEPGVQPSPGTQPVAKRHRVVALRRYEHWKSQPAHELKAEVEKGTTPKLVPAASDAIGEEAANVAADGAS